MSEKLPHNRLKSIAVHAVLGSRLDPPFDTILHRCEHRDGLEIVTIAAGDMARRRLRVTGSKDTEFLIALPRDSGLYDGAVIVAEEDYAAVVRVDEERWLRLAPKAAADALELGYHAGNLHWRVRFVGTDLLIALEGPSEGYLARIAPMIEARRVQVVGLDS